MNWNQIEKTLEAWAEVLTQIQKEAAEAVSRGDNKLKSKVKMKVFAFIEHSPGFVSGIEELDREAAKTIIDMNNADIEAALGRIDERSARIKILTKSVLKAAANAKASAKSIMLEEVTDLIGQLTDVISKARKIKENVDEMPVNLDLAKELDSVSESANQLIQKFRTTETS